MSLHTDLEKLAKEIHEQLVQGLSDDGNRAYTDVYNLLHALLSKWKGKDTQGLRDAFVAGAKFTPLSGRPELWIDQVKAEALRLYPDAPPPAQPKLWRCSRCKEVGPLIIDSTEYADGETYHVTSEGEPCGPVEPVEQGR
jgi:hypothetical protein